MVTSPRSFFGLLQKSEWAVLARRKWCKSDNILLLEARALLRGLEVSVSLRGDLSRRCVILTDNMSVCLVLSRRRARNFKLLCMVRKFFSFCVALGLQVCVRWIPSEQNSADSPSRMADVFTQSLP